MFVSVLGMFVGMDKFGGFFGCYSWCGYGFLKCVGFICEGVVFVV